MQSDSTNAGRHPIAATPGEADLHPQATSGPQRSLAGLAAAYPRVFLALVTAVYAYGAICAASRRHFEFDEIMTYYLAELPDIRQIWSAIANGIELNPPLPFWITWVIHHTAGGGEVLSRIPAIFGFWLTCFCLYHFVKRRCGAVFGFAAFMLPLFTYPASDSAVARGYGLMLGFSALALLCWQMAADKARRPLALVGLAVGVAGAVSCHYYAVYVVGAICAGEIVRTIDRRKVDVAMWIAFIAGLSPLAAYAPLVRAATTGAMKNFWVSAEPKFIYDSYADLLGPGMMVFLLLLVILLRRGHGERDGEVRWAPPALRSHEVAVCLLLLAMPLVFYLAGIFGGVPFYTRYVMPVTLGFGIVMPLFAHRIGRDNLRFQRVLISLMIWCCLLPWTLFQTSKLITTKRPTVGYLAGRPSLPADTSLPVVFDSETDFIEYYHYGAPQLRSRIYNLVNRNAAVRFRGTDTGLRSIAIAQTMRELHTVDYYQFLREHREFYVVRFREEGWILQQLIEDGEDISLLSLKKDLGTFVQSNTIFRVSVPAITGR